jgi:hypothetical protein
MNLRTDGAGTVLLVGTIVMVVMAIFNPQEPSYLLAFWIILTISGIASVLWLDAASLRKRQAAFGARETLPTPEIVRRYYTDLGVDEAVVARLWDDCADALRLPPGKLRPTDRLREALVAFEDGIASRRLRDVDTYVKAYAHKHGCTIDVRHAVLVDDLIRQLARCEARQPAGEDVRLRRTT